MCTYLVKFGRILSTIMTAMRCLVRKQKRGSVICMQICVGSLKFYRILDLANGCLILYTYMGKLNRFYIMQQIFIRCCLYAKTFMQRYETTIWYLILRKIVERTLANITWNSKILLFTRVRLSIPEHNLDVLIPNKINSFIYCYCNSSAFIVNVHLNEYKIYGKVTKIKKWNPLIITKMFLITRHQTVRMHVT